MNIRYEVDCQPTQHVIKIRTTHNVGLMCLVHLRRSGCHTEGSARCTIRFMSHLRIRKAAGNVRVEPLRGPCFLVRGIKAWTCFRTSNHRPGLSRLATIPRYQEGSSQLIIMFSLSSTKVKFVWVQPARGVVNLTHCPKALDTLPSFWRKCWEGRKCQEHK